MIRILSLLIILAQSMICPAFATERSIELEAWRITLPLIFEQRMGSRQHAYGAEVAGRYHTLVFDVVRAGTLTWNDVLPVDRKDTRLSSFERRSLIESILDGAANRVVENIGHEGGRIRDATAKHDDGEVLPAAGMCRLVRWQVGDVGVPGHEGTVFTMHGYDLFCADFSERHKDFDYIRLSFSERFCTELKHTPLADFSDRARRIFASLGYRHGPRHRMPDLSMINRPSPEGSLFLAGPVPANRAHAVTICGH